ncbi:presenilin family intramembrane aspartyl protease PSH [Methanococcoides sp. AM1]|uniref:presenilin family intramembrane aspartyl protease PSH n=1 Tax=Methanococcoides sp. AM1 TaxID=1201011 RepID=UPI0010826066|nr:presenilin family intramembrane aspartyl protease PSH [Methanococcoides sp. AM1]
MSSEKDTFRDYLPMLVMAGLILVIQSLALFLASPMDELGMRAVENPESTANSLYYIGFILVFTFLLLMAIKRNMKWVIQLTILLAVAATVYYGFYPMFFILGFNEAMSNAIAIPLAIALTALLYKYPEWYVIDITGIIIAAAASSIFGISFGIAPAIVLLSLLAIYDAISVYKTKHMIALAEGVMDLKLPILFVIPKKLNYSFIKDSLKAEGERDAFFMGLGDAVMPTVLVVSANVFIEHTGFISYPALGAMAGTIIGFFALTIFVMKGKPQAGLPFLNGGVILGYIAGALLSGTPILG